MIILYELVDFIKVIRIKMFALCATSDQFGKGLRFIGVCLGDLSFVVVVLCWIVPLTLRLEEVLDFAPRLDWIGL